MRLFIYAVAKDAHTVARPDAPPNPPHPPSSRVLFAQFSAPNHFAGATVASSSESWKLEILKS